MWSAVSALRNRTSGRPVRLATSEVADSRRPRSERSERTARDGYTDDEAARGATRQPSAKWPWFAGWGLGRGDQLEAAQRHNEERKGPCKGSSIDERSSCASDPDPAGTRRGGTTIGHVTHDDRRRSSSSSTLDRPYRRTDGDGRDATNILIQHLLRMSFVAMSLSAHDTSLMRTDRTADVVS